jgi:DNA-directed RNA polymerase specialized sigma24 family protein
VYEVCPAGRGRLLRAAGYSYKEIADLLCVTYTNVNRHVTEGRAELLKLREAA